VSLLTVTLYVQVDVVVAAVDPALPDAAAPIAS
jgi:hypothetical protein